MVLMALDHARAFLFSAVDPENLARASAPLFLTRWVTHFSAPAFVFLAGTAAALSLGREQTPARLARFLVTRGIWLILLELTVVRLSWTFFAAERSTVWLLVLWALGCSMLVLALFTRVPAAVAALVGGLLIAGHNTLDNVRFSGLLERVWNVLHVPGPEVGTVLGQTIRVGYPLIPWIGVMLVGWSYGAALRSPRWQDRAIRRRETLLMGGALLALFVALRVLNGYGDPSPWTRHADALTTLLSFLRLEKYPPSLGFLLMTLGPLLLLLAVWDRPAGWLGARLAVIGRVPLFFYLLHLPLLHLLGSLLYGLSFGSHGMWRPPWLRSDPGSGQPLVVVYAAWLVVLLLALPLCRRWAELKERRSDWWLRYL